MAKSKNKGLGVDMCCESCKRCTKYPDGTYTCKKNEKITKVIEGYMPTQEYYWCKGELFGPLSRFSTN